MKNAEATIEPMKFWMEEDYEVEGYLVTTEFRNRIVKFPAFTMEQAEKVASLNNDLVYKYDDGVPEQYALLKFNEDESCWEEYYYDGLYSRYWDIKFADFPLYAIGSEWPWSW